MSRFGAYLESAKTSRLLIGQAEDSLRKGDDKRALKMAIGALREMITANNNLASIAFKKKPKPARRPQYDTPESITARVHGLAL